MTTDQERRLVAVLHQHAEDAMSRTNTEEQLELFLDRHQHGDRTRRIAWTAAAALTAAAVAAAALWGPDVLQDRSAPAPAPPTDTEAEEVARGFVEAYAAHDPGDAAGYLAPDATVWRGWRAEMRWGEAAGFTVLLDTCEELYRLPSGTEVSCLFDYHALHSEELGRGPFGNGLFTFTVRDGRIQEAHLATNHEGNGFMDLWDDFAAWVEQRHPRDAELMFADWPRPEDPEQYGRYLELWEQRSAEYAAETAR